ncbi:MAG: 1-acyl-sn-glycerol-3-phosphate acyltransferase [Spirochaetia bacterium]|jgi:glycerol-3-phosphate O-acyltransferase|nr:1-acyl-sn-glycerol-3-phosphate acyltransferase [Spirochaetales bacterium]MDX9783820.1 1-acyl-sn-glycerol-3-phosphate acyltransferase [Spirochaetia bacterium]
MESIPERYKPLLSKLMGDKKLPSMLSEDNVYQEGRGEILPYIDQILEDHLLPNSRIEGFEHLTDLYDRASRGESCLLLVEHYSNFDLPVLHYLLRRQGGPGKDIAASIVAIAGIKLSESNPLVSAFTNAYTRLVIYPSRSLEIIKKRFKEPGKLYHEIRRSMTINRAAVKKLSELKHSGRLVLVFPAGTRFRPWDPGSKKGVREIASYIKSFDNFCMVAINGNILRINPSGEMEDDLLHKDKVIFTASSVYKSEELIQHVKAAHQFKEDKKQELVDHIMDDLEAMHAVAEEKRLADPGAEA